MPASRWTRRFYDSTRGRIVALLRGASLTVDQLARRLGLTGNAVRAHLAVLERDGLLEQQLLRSGGAGKPAVAYHIAPDAEPLFSSAYAPVLSRLLDELGQRLDARELETLMRAVGHGLAAGRAVPSGSVHERARAAADALNELGAIAEVEERDGTIRVRGYACPLSVTVHEHPAMCVALEAMLSDLAGTPVRQCCDRTDSPRCCFEFVRDEAAIH